MAFSTIDRNLTFPTTIPFSIQKSTDMVDALDLDLTIPFSIQISTLIFEFKKKGIVVGKVKVMANCKKKPRQIVQLRGQPSQG